MPYSRCSFAESEGNRRVIAFLKGILVDTSEDCVYVDVNGIGFEVIVPSRALGRLTPLGQEIFLYTYLQSLENEFRIYGFLKKDEREMFQTLLSIPGLGAKTCLGVISAMTTEELYRAVVAGDEKSLTAIPGIGRKTAQRLIFELRNKLPKSAPMGKMPSEPVRSSWDDTLAALEALGFKSYELIPLLSQLEASNELGDAIEENVKKVLKLKGATVKS